MLLLFWDERPKKREVWIVSCHGVHQAKTSCNVELKLESCRRSSSSRGRCPGQKRSGTTIEDIVMMCSWTIDA